MDTAQITQFGLEQLLSVEGLLEGLGNGKNDAIKSPSSATATASAA